MPTKQNLLDSYLSNIDIIGEGLPVMPPPRST